MAGRGPAPDPLRFRHDKPARGDWHAADAVGWQHGKVPPCPADVEPATRRAWKTWFGSWVAAFWTPEDVPGLRMVARIYDSVERGNYQRAPELRLWMDTYGLTPKGQQDRRWRPPDEPKVAKPASLPRLPVTSARERFARLDDA
jgi:hypothetical protein